MDRDDSLLTVDLNSSFGSGIRINNGMDQYGTDRIELWIKATINSFFNSTLDRN